MADAPATTTAKNPAAKYNDELRDRAARVAKMTSMKQPTGLSDHLKIDKAVRNMTKAKPTAADLKLTDEQIISLSNRTAARSKPSGPP